MLMIRDRMITIERVSISIDEALWMSSGSYTRRLAITGVIGDGCVLDTAGLPIRIRLVLTSVITWIDVITRPTLTDLKIIGNPCLLYTSDAADE